MLKFGSDPPNSSPEVDTAEDDDPAQAPHLPRRKNQPPKKLHKQDQSQSQNRSLTDNLTEAVPQDVVKAVPGQLDTVTETLQGVTARDQTQAPVKKEEDKKESLRIHIELNLDVEVHLTARVKGDVTIGLL